MKRHAEFLTYLTGIVLFGLFYYQIRPFFNDLWFICVLLVYFFYLRFLGKYISLRIAKAPRARRRDAGIKLAAFTVLLGMIAASVIIHYPRS